MVLGVTLRPVGIADAEAMAAVLAGPSLYEFTGGEPPSVDELRQRYAAQARGTSSDGSQEWINLVVMLAPDDRPIGYVQATVPRGGGPAEIAWVIGQAWQGRGHATQAVRLLVEHLQARGVQDIVAHIHPGHAASQSVARHIGMAPTDITVDGETRWELGRLTR